MRRFLTNKFTIIFIIILAIALPVTIWQVQRSQDVRQRASGGSTITANITPISGSFTTGTPFSVDLTITSTNDVGSVQFTVTYDPAKVTLTSITPQSPYTLATESSTANSKTVTFLNITPTQVIGQNVKVATITFSPLSAGISEITINPIMFTASGGPVTVDQASVLSGSYTITGETVATPTSAQNPTPTNGIPEASPTSSVQSGDTSLDLSLKLLGIGASSTPSDQLNSHPKRTTRQGDVIVYDGNLNVVDTYPLTANFNPATASYSATADLGNLPTGDYLIKFRLDNTLFKFIPGIQKITGGTANSYPDTLELISGDVVRGGTSENIIDIQDYSAVNACLSADISNVAAQGVNDPTCGLQIGLKSDFNDDDMVDLKDYNIILRAFTKRIGD